LILEPKRLRKIAENLENEREKRRDVTQTKEELFGKPPRCCMQLVPSKYIAVLQKQQAKACWKCCKNTKKVTEISVYTQKFPANK
jgi:hypothetical protein